MAIISRVMLHKLVCETRYESKNLSRLFHSLSLIPSGRGEDFNGRPNYVYDTDELLRALMDRLERSRSGRMRDLCVKTMRVVENYARSMDG